MKATRRMLFARLRIARIAVIEMIPFIAPCWKLAARVAKLLSPFHTFKPITLYLALRIHRTARNESARLLVEPIIRQTDWRLIRTCKQSQLVNDITRQRLLSLKPFVPPAEKGVLKVMFSETCRLLPSLPRFADIINKYTLVLEPSWTGASDISLLQYENIPSDVVVLAGAESDLEFLRRLGSSLKPIRIGPCDWVDPRIAEPYLGSRKIYDLVMNSTWATWKRHHLLFRALAKLPRRLSVALVGVPWDGGTIDDVMDAAKLYDIDSCLTVFEGIPYEQVMKITCSSRAAILLSLKEGSNRALTEAMFCNVPVILLDTHWGGVTKNIVPETGVMCEERNLHHIIDKVSREAVMFTPRAWAKENISCTVSTTRLNSFLKELATKRGEKWTRDIVVHSNSPECKYYNPTAEAEPVAASSALEEYLVSA
jgi:glycosyltransferase involved in cell wall biosynthesis